MTDDTFNGPSENPNNRFAKIIIPTIEVILLAALVVIGLFFANAVLSPSIPKKAQQPEYDTDDLVNAEDLEISAKSRAFSTGGQDTKAFTDGKWKGDSQLFVWDVKENDWIEWKIPVSEKSEYKISVFLTKATDYGIVQLSMAGKPIGPKIDLWANDYRIKPTGPIDLGTYRLSPPAVKLRLQVVGRNEKNLPPHYQFGIDGFILEDVGE
jgi:hypothetical protein